MISVIRCPSSLILRTSLKIWSGLFSRRPQSIRDSEYPLIETAEQAALREIAEEIGLKPERIRFLFSAWHAKRDQLMLCFCAESDAADFTLSQEVSEAHWFAPEDACKAVRSGSIIERLVHAAIL